MLCEVLILRKRGSGGKSLSHAEGGGGGGHNKCFYSPPPLPVIYDQSFSLE